MVLSSKYIEDSNIRNRYGVGIMSSEEKNRLDRINNAFNQFTTKIANIFVVDYRYVLQECVKCIDEMINEKTNFKLDDITSVGDDTFCCKIILQTKSEQQELISLEMIDGETLELLQDNIFSEDVRIYVDLRRQNGLSSLDKSESESAIKTAVNGVVWSLVNNNYVMVRRNYLTGGVLALNKYKSDTNLHNIADAKSIDKIIKEFDDVLSESSKGIVFGL